MRCEEISPTLAGVVDGDVRLSRNDRRHVEQCLRCQAELSQYRKLLRAMHALRSDQADVPSGAVADVLARLEAAGEQSAVRAVITGRKVIRNDESRVEGGGWSVSVPTLKVFND